VRHATRKDKLRTYRGLRLDVSAQRGEQGVGTIVSVDGGVLPLTQRAATLRPSGYEWGSEQSSEALAHALLAYEFDIDVAERFYQEYAQTVVAHLPATGANGTAWTITSADLRAWLNERLV
jgi:hypothetical protein